jgi:hypothetical protein
MGCVVSTLDDQIRAVYGQGVGIEEICEQFRCSEAAVKWALQDSEDFTDADAAAMAAVIKQVALAGDNERNRLTAAMYVYDVKKGLRVPKREAPTISAVQINQLIFQAQQDVHRLVGNPTGVGASESTVAPPDQPPEPRADQVEDRAGI